MPTPAQEVLEEIVVTALKRAESLQAAPATVTVFDADRMEEAGISSMRDYVSLTSNMTLMETQNNAFAFVNIRGGLPNPERRSDRGRDDRRRALDDGPSLSRRICTTSSRSKS